VIHDVRAGEWVGADNAYVRLIALRNSADGSVLACTHEEYDAAQSAERAPVGTLWPLERLSWVAGHMAFQPR
jgi:hypothetical protein